MKHQFSARVLGFALVVGGGAIGLTVGAWIAPVLLALLHGGWHDLTTIPIKEYCFPGQAAWIGYAVGQIVSALTVLMSLAGMILGAWTGNKYWRVIVVRKLSWMTDSEFAEFMQSFPEG